MAKVLLALDQSTATTGWALFINDELKEYGHFDPKGEYLERISKLCGWVLSFIKKYDRKLKIGIEDIQLQAMSGASESQNVLTFKKLAHAQGALLELFEELGIEYEIVSPASWKSSCKIKGTHRAEQKKNAQLFIEQTYGNKVTQDAADAICLGLHIIKKEPFNWAN